MRKVLTADQMREVDRLTTAEYGVPSITLMENAAHAVFDVINDKLGGSVEGRRAVVLCGKGNNGGDGAALLRLLHEAGAEAEGMLLGRISDTSGDARINFEKFVDLDSANASGFEIGSKSEIDAFWDAIRDSEKPVDVIVDAVFGTGLDRPVEGIFEYFIDSAALYADESDPRPLLVSIDIPSGVNSDLAEPIGYSFLPDLTVTFTAPKIANVVPPVCRTQGELYVRDIGSPAELAERADSALYLSDTQDARDWLDRTKFSESSYKRTRGNVLVLAGSEKYPGAAVLAANGAMRSGAGIVTVATPAPAYPAVSRRILPEIMARSVSATESGSFSRPSIDETADLRDSADAILIGCGITSDSEETREFVREIAATRKCPLVIDADGLNSLSPFENGFREGHPLILTPHEGEFRRLTGDDSEPTFLARIESLREFAVGRGVICLLKGEKAMVAGPDGKIVVNPTGNAGLGKAGNGDTLAGIIAGFTAQETASSGEQGGAGRNFDAVFGAVVAGLYAGGLAGDIAAELFGKRVMTASDVRECLTAAFRRIGSAD